MAVIPTSSNIRMALAAKPGFLASTRRPNRKSAPPHLQKRFPTGRADYFLRTFEASSLETHSKRILAAHTLPNPVCGCHLEEAAQFFVQVFFDPFLSE
jgi:hypothetical protein